MQIFRDWEDEELTAVGEVLVQAHLRNLKVHRSVRTEEMYLHVVKEVVKH